MTRVKICGLRTPGDVEAVNLTRPDYVGFVFAPSRRRISFECAALLRRLLCPEITAVGVFVNEKVGVIARLAGQGIIGAVQLHGDEDDAYRRELKRMVTCPVMQAVAAGDVLPDRLPDYCDFKLFDTASAAMRGGTGVSFNWSVLKGIREPFFLAGGLNEENVARAIAMTAPYCVDVSGGVESDGQKDAEKIRRFIDAVRQTNIE